MTKRWERIRDDIAGMLDDGESLESIIGKLEEMKNEMQKLMTNEEWFCQLPTYKKAIIMANCYEAFNLDQYACNKHVVIEEWLKEIHHE